MNNIHSNLTKWSVASRIFHWVSALLLLVTWIMILLYDNLDSKVYIGLHNAVGGILLFWLLARVSRRIYTNAPPALAMPKWQMLLAQLSHFALYALLIAMPMAGLLMSVYGGRAVDVFGLFQVPVFVTPDRGLARLFNDWHTDILWPMIIVFSLMLIGAALCHLFI